MAKEMDREELEKKKLCEEIRHLQAPIWKQSAYITIVSTVFLAMVGFISTQSSEQKKEIEALKLQTQALKEETLRWQIEDKKRQLEKYKELSKKVDEIIFERYSRGFVDGVIASPSGQKRVDEIVANPSKEAIEDFVVRITDGTLDAASKKRIEKLKELLAE
ncbi:hypothetical protein [Pseudoalteromonas ruthenica]|uniref:hypothetical protein n=1 Tax=Pseudoalteromonas ruthenica TaxID=151081 RepID=UPI0003B68CC1|nr:hypothetical protein [Pseudoalteromonas ruthenica]